MRALTLKVLAAPFVAVAFVGAVLVFVFGAIAVALWPSE